VISATRDVCHTTSGNLVSRMPEARSAGLLKEAQRAGDVSLLRFASVLLPRRISWLAVCLGLLAGIRGRRAAAPRRSE